MTIPGRGVVRDQGVRAESSRGGPAKPSEQKRDVNRMNYMKVGCQLAAFSRWGVGLPLSTGIPLRLGSDQGHRRARPWTQKSSPSQFGGQSFVAPTH